MFTSEKECPNDVCEMRSLCKKSRVDRIARVVERKQYVFSGLNDFIKYFNEESEYHLQSCYLQRKTQRKTVLSQNPTHFQKQRGAFASNDAKFFRFQTENFVIIAILKHTYIFTLCTFSFNLMNTTRITFNLI